MPGIPGPAGFAAFVAVKFSGYTLAGLTLRKLQPAITAGAAKIAATKTAFGLLFGLPVSIGGLFVLEQFRPPEAGNEPPYALYFLIAAANRRVGTGDLDFLEAHRSRNAQALDLCVRGSRVVLPAGLARNGAGLDFARQNTVLLSDCGAAQFTKVDENF